MELYNRGGYDVNKEELLKIIDDTIKNIWQNEIA